MFWTQAPWSSDRNAVSNMPGAQVGLRLHQLTGRRSTSNWSLRMYAWVNRHLQRPDRLFHDHLDLQGTVEKTFWSSRTCCASSRSPAAANGGFTVLAWPRGRYRLLY